MLYPPSFFCSYDFLLPPNPPPLHLSSISRPSLSALYVPVVGDVESLYLLATCLYRSGRLQQAHHLLSKLTPSCHAPSNLLHATICLDLNESVSFCAFTQLHNNS